MKKIQLWLFSGLMTLLSSAFADSPTASLQTTATLSDSCMINTVTAASFTITPSATSTYVYLNRPAVLRCTRGTPYTISISAGTSGNMADRFMTSSTSSDTLHYNVYTDTSFSAIWGDGTNGTVTVSNVGIGSGVNIPPVVRLFTNQFATPGVYTDTLSYTISY